MGDSKILPKDKTAGVDGSEGSYQSHLRTASCSSKPAWLLSTLNDLDQKIRTLLLNSHEDKDQDQADTFAQRAELYYQQRPQLLSLLQDLYNTYLYLADRYSQSLHRLNPQNHHHRACSLSEHHSAASSIHMSSADSDYLSDAESSLSYQLPSALAATPYHQNRNSDEIIAELVIRNVEFDLMMHELGLRERQAHESARKIELQRSLLEVLESERLILLNENAGLRYKISAVVEENNDLVSESLFMKRKAGELARCVMKMSDDHRICMLSRKIEDLQWKIYGLKKRNHDYYQQLVKAKSSCPSCKGGGTSGEVKWEDVEGVSAKACFQGIKQMGAQRKGVKIFKWWEKIKNSDLLFLCKPHSSETFG